MSDDLIKQWDEYVESMGSVMGEVEHMAQQMRDRIEELERDREKLGREVNMAKYGEPNFAWSIHKAAMADLNAKLAKAIDEMTWALPILKRCLTHPNDEYKVEDFRTVLAELEGEK